MSKKVKIIISVVFLFILFLGYCWINQRSSVVSINPTIKLSSEAMKTDLDYLLTELKASQPNLKNTPEAYSRIISTLYNDIKKPMYFEDFYFELNKLFVALKDGHSHLMSIDSTYIKLPALQWSNDGLIVAEKNSNFEMGDRIISIGGIRADILGKKLIELIPAEIPEWVRANVNDISKGMYLTHLGLVHDNKVIIEYERNDLIKKVDLTLSKGENSFINSIKSVFAEASSQIPRWRLDKENNMGVITINTCEPGKKNIKVFNKFFKAVNGNKVKNIIVDLRKNKGGSDDVINLFLSYVNVHDYLGLYDESPSLVTVNPEQIRGVSKIDPPLFSGNIYILTSNATFSSATDFTVILQSNNIAKVIGQPTGNIPHFYGNSKADTLPNSKIRFQYSTTRFKAPVPEEAQDKAITPDYPVQYSRQDIINSKDPWLSKATELCNE